MSVFSSIMKWFGKSDDVEKTLQSRAEFLALSDAASDDAFTRTSKSDHDAHNQIIRAYTGNSELHGLISKEADIAASFPLEVVRKLKDGHVEPAPTTRFQGLLDYPNPYLSAPAFVRDMVISYRLFGEVFVAIDELDNLQYVLSVLNPTKVRVVPDKKKRTRAFEYKPIGAQKGVVYPDELVMYMCKFNPLNFYYGLSPVVSADLDLQVSQWAKRLIAANAKTGEPPFLAITHGNIGEDEIAFIKKEFRRRVPESTRFLPLDAQWSVVELAQRTTRQAGMEAATQGAEALCRLFGYPLSWVNSSSANYDEAADWYYTYTLYPLLEMLTKSLTHKFGYMMSPRGEKLIVRPSTFNHPALARIHVNQTRTLTALRNSGAITPNEERKILGFPAYTGNLAKYGNTPTPVWALENGTKPDAASETGGLTGAMGGRDQTEYGEDLQIDASGVK